MAKRSKRRKNPSGVRIIHNKLLGGWFIVRGPHQTPIGGRFSSKAEAKAHLRRKNPRRKKNESYWVEMRGTDNSLIAIGRVFSRKKNAIREAKRAAIGFEGKVYVAIGTPEKFRDRLKRLGQ
jgi:hypothetical protein